MYKVIIVSIILIILLYIIKNNYDEINTQLTIKKMEDDYNNSTEEHVIPFNIFQTWHTKDLDLDMEKCVNQLKANNPEFKHHLFDDKDCRQFIQQYFDKDVVDAFDSLIPGAYKADLWRLCVLYIHGGIYMDIKFQCVNGFKLKYLTFSEHLVADIYDGNYMLFDNYKYIYNAVMVCKSKNPFLLDCIKQLVNNVKHQYYGKSILHVTGPALLGFIYKNDNYKIPIDMYNEFSLNFSKQFNGEIIYKNIPIIDTYPNYRKNQLFILFKQPDNTDYRVLWFSKNIYN